MGTRDESLYVMIFRLIMQYVRTSLQTSFIAFVLTPTTQMGLLRSVEHVVGWLDFGSDVRAEKVLEQ